MTNAKSSWLDGTDLSSDALGANVAEITKEPEQKEETANNLAGVFAPPQGEPVKQNKGGRPPKAKPNVSEPPAKTTKAAIASTSSIEDGAPKHDLKESPKAIAPKLLLCIKDFSVTVNGSSLRFKVKNLISDPDVIRAIGQECRFVVEVTDDLRMALCPSCNTKHPVIFESLEKIETEEKF